MLSAVASASGTSKADVLLNTMRLRIAFRSPILGSSARLLGSTFFFFFLKLNCDFPFFGPPMALWPVFFFFGGIGMERAELVLKAAMAPGLEDTWVRERRWDNWSTDGLARHRQHVEDAMLAVFQCRDTEDRD